MCAFNVILHALNVPVLLVSALCVPLLWLSSTSLV